MRWLRAKLRALAAAMLAEHRAPGRVAAAVFVGVMVGCTPFFGLHIFIGLVLAILFRLNKIIVYAAANVSIPPLVPFIGFTSVQLGERLRHGHFLPLTLAVFRSEPAKQLAPRFFVSWMLGGTVLGAALGSVGAVIALLWLRRRVDLDTIAQAMEVARQRYDAASSTLKGRALVRYPQYRTIAWYARIKYATDPCYRAIATQIGPGTFTVDLGTGLGMLPVLLGVMGQRRALGVEWDEAKARAGQRAAEGIDVEVAIGDVRSFAIPPCDVVTLVDMLHYYDADTQRTLLSRCAVAAPKLLIREGDAARKGGSSWTRGIESVVTKLGWNRGPKVRFRPIEDLETDLHQLGYTTARLEVAGKLHPGNVLLVATRRPAPDA